MSLGGDRPAISLQRVTKFFAAGNQRAQTPAVDDVSLAIDRGDFVVLLGPSGCGKTTLLKIINRLEEPTSGRLLIDGRDVLNTDPTELRRSIGYVIQQVGLFPHMSIAKNIAVVPSLLHWPAAKISQRIDELLTLVHLTPEVYRDRYPRQLSGGQQQRVGIARALAADPPILLMDEPFGAVDAIERAHLQTELMHLQAKLRKTIVFVTHDVDEALHLADRVVIMRQGRVEQYATALTTLTQPATGFVADLVDARDTLRRLSLIKVREVMGPPSDSSGQPISAAADLKSALTLMLAGGGEQLTVLDAESKKMGTVTLAAIRTAAVAREPAA